MNPAVTTVWPARTLLSAFALALLLSGCHAAEAPPRIEWQVAASRVDVRQLPAQWRVPPAGGSDWPKLLLVTVAGGDGTPMLGEYSMTTGDDGERSLRFVPRFPFEPGVTYRASIPELKLESSFTVPVPPRPAPAVVTHVYPSADDLPENLLRIYVHFSEPMRRGEAYDSIRLLNANGKRVLTPFLTLGEELWDESGKRLTLLFDPGRIKHGLRPREDLGPILDAGQSYTLVIDPRWRDAHGQPLQREHRKTFTVGKPADFGIDCAQWTIEPPAAGTRSPLTVRFPAPLDHALLHEMIVVVGSDGQPVRGQVRVADQERTWRWEPNAAWQPGDYEIVVYRTLEDVAGNRVGRPFEVDGDTRPAHADGPPVRRAFAIR